MTLLNKLDIEVKCVWHEVDWIEKLPEEWLEATWNNRKFGTIQNGEFVPTQFKDETEVLFEILQLELGGVEVCWWDNRDET